MSADPFTQRYIPMIQGIISLFAPFVEIAIHDVESGRISAIFNDITNRKVGDISPLKTLQLPVDQFPDVFEPYYETNWDGRKIKCTTITVRDDHHKPVTLICINFDVSVFSDMQVNLETFLKVRQDTGNPVELYGGNWQEKIDDLISHFLLKHKLILGKLSREQKKSLIEELSKEGVFFFKNAAPYIAQKLDISRATIYNYLKILRAD